MKLKSNSELKHGDLRVWWIPQVPMKAFEVDVPDAKTGKLLLDALADYDAFQFRMNVKPDYANMGGLKVWDERLDADEDGKEWTDWEDDDFNDIDQTESFMWEGATGAMSLRKIVKKFQRSISSVDELEFVNEDGKRRVKVLDARPFPATADMPLKYEVTWSIFTPATHDEAIEHGKAIIAAAKWAKRQEAKGL